MKNKRALMAGLLTLLMIFNVGKVWAQETGTEGPEVWEATRYFGPTMKGTLRLWVEEGEARVELNGLKGRAKIAESRAVIDFGRDKGRFELQIDGDIPRGLWIQPRMQARSNTEYSTPVRLSHMRLLLYSFRVALE